MTSLLSFFSLSARKEGREGRGGRMENCLMSECGESGEIHFFLFDDDDDDDDDARKNVGWGWGWGVVDVYIF